MVPEGWKRQRLDDLLDFKNGVNTEAENYGSGVKFVNVMDVFQSPALTQDIIRGSVQLTDAQRRTYALRRGDILFNRTSETREDIAVASVYLDDRPAVFGGFVIRGRPKRDWLHPEFSRYCFMQPAVRREFVRRGQGVIRANIGQRDLAEVDILLPPTNEQERLALLLKEWDDAVAVLGRLVANGERQQRALVQQLVWGKIRVSSFKTRGEFQQTKYGRIPADWQFPPIGEVARETKDRSGGREELPVLACSKHAGFVESLKYFKKQVFSDDTSNYKVVRRGWYGFPSNHIEEGSLGYQDICEAGLVSPIYCVFRTTDAVCDGYLYRLLKTDHYRQIFAAATNASVDRRGSLRWKQFSRIHVPLPPLEEQKAIAAVCDAADRELDTLKRTLVNVERQRTALMQQLLTGKRRLAVGESTHA